MVCKGSIPQPVQRVPEPNLNHPVHCMVKRMQYRVSISRQSAPGQQHPVLCMRPKIDRRDAVAKIDKAGFSGNVVSWDFRAFKCARLQHVHIRIRDVRRSRIHVARSADVVSVRVL